jgi:ribose transport system substrate-binding protein
MNRIRHTHKLIALVAVAVLAIGACSGSSASPSAEGTASAATSTAPSIEASVAPSEATAACATGTADLGIPTDTTVALFTQMAPGDGSATVDTTAVTKEGPYTIGFSDWGLVNSHRVQTREAMNILATQLGITLKITDAGGDVNKQIADVDDLLTQNVNALVIAPAVADALAPAIEKAFDKGIPVVVFQSDPGTEKITSYVHALDADFGVAGMTQLAKDMNGKGNLIALRGIAGNPVETARYEGMASVLADYPDIKLVGEDFGDWNEDKGKAVAQNLLAANPQIDGVWSSGAAMTKGAIAAFQEANRPLPPMSGEHLNGFLKLWQELGMKSVAPVYPSWMGPEALKVAVLSLQGQCVYNEYVPNPPAITNNDLASAIKADISDDAWIEGYLTDEQLKTVFPN